jgi:hypothetical protein
MRPPKQDSHIRKAKGIDHELFAIEVGFNKVMFFPKSGKGSHYTLHFGVHRRSSLTFILDQIGPGRSVTWPTSPPCLGRS